MQISRNNMYHHSFFCGVCYITASCLWLNSLGLPQIKILNQSRISGIHKVVALNVGNVKKNNNNRRLQHFALFSNTNILNILKSRYIYWRWKINI